MEKSIINRMIADFLLNISAGWMGALVLVPYTSHKKLKMKGLASIMNIINIVLSLIISYIFYRSLL